MAPPQWLPGFVDDMPPENSPLADIRKNHEFFVGIDSDGCVFDTMELKHKECFIPEIIAHYDLQSVSKYARQVAEFVNLYSCHRGINRFPGLVLTLDLLRARPEVSRRGCSPPTCESLRRFSESGSPLGNPALRAAVETSQDAELQRALEWSESVNRAIARMVHGVSPFPGVRETLGALSQRADMAVVSSTPVAALEAEWREHDLARFVQVIAGQEAGSKKETLGAALRAGFPPERILMIGDAPGDRRAAEAHGASFFPILPGAEDESWTRLHEEGLERFFRGEYRGEYEESLTRAFLSSLPETPPWER